MANTDNRKTGNKVPENKAVKAPEKVPFDPKSLLGKVSKKTVSVPVPAMASGNGRGNDIPSEIKRNVVELSRRFFKSEGNVMIVKVWNSVEEFQTSTKLSIAKAMKIASQDPQTYHEGLREIAQYHSRMLGSSFLYSHGILEVENIEGHELVTLSIVADGIYSEVYPVRQAGKGWTAQEAHESLVSKFRSGYVYQTGWQVVQSVVPELFQEVSKFYKPRNK